MRVVIVGATEVGIHLAELLSADQHDILVIDQDAALVERLAESLDAMVVSGNGATPKVLAEAEVHKAEMLLATTDHDETNITACLVAKHLGVGHTVARLHNPDYISAGSSTRNTLGIDFVIHTEQMVAEKIKSTLLLPGALNLESFAEGRITVAEVVLDEGSSAAGSAVRDIKMPERTLILGGVRHGQALMSRGDTVLEAGDHIFVISDRERIREAVGGLASNTEPVEEVTVLGGGRAGLSVMETLQDTVLSLKVLERDAARADYVASRLEGVSVVHQPELTLDSLADAGVDHADAFIALTQDDRTNLTASMYAKQLGVRHTICGMSRGELIPLSEELGVDITISGRVLAASVISRFVRKGEVVAVSMLESGAQMIELTVAEDSRVTGRSLAELDFPKQAIVGMVLRGGIVIIPHGDDVLEPGDDVVIFATHGVVDRVERFFAPSSQRPSGLHGLRFLGQAHIG